MSELSQREGKRMNSKVRSTVLVLVVPLFLLAVLGVATGTIALGTPDILILAVIWAVGLFLVWRPRHAKQ